MSPLIGPRYLAAVTALGNRFGVEPPLGAGLLHVMIANGAAITVAELVEVALLAADNVDPLRNPQVQTVYSDRVNEDRRKKP